MSTNINADTNLEVPITAGGGVIEDGNSDNGGSANDVAMPEEDPQNEMIPEKGAKTGKFKAFGAKMKEKRANNIAKITNRIQEVKTKRSETKRAKED